MKNGTLLAVILFAIVFVGAFISTPEGAEEPEATTSDISEPISADEIAASIILTTMATEQYRIVGKIFDPYLLSVVRLSSENTFLLSHHFNSGDTTATRSRILSLRSKTPIEIILESTGTEIECADLEIGDRLLITRDADTNMICKVFVSRDHPNTSD